MNNLKTIAKWSLKEQLFPFKANKTAPNLPKNYAGRIIMIIINYLFLCWIFFVMATGSAMAFLGQANDEVMYFASFGLVTTLMLLTIYLPQMLSNFFKAKDIDLYKTLPVGEGELFLGKFAGVILGNADFILFFIIYLGVYFSHRGFDLVKLILGLVNFFPMVTIPYGIMIGLILVINRFTNLARHKKLFKTLGYILMFAFIGAIYYYSFSSNNNDMDAENISKVLGSLGGISNVLFNSKLFGLAVGGGIGQQLIYTLALCAISGLICFVLYKMADKFYYRAISGGESAPAKKAKAKKKKTGSLKAKSPMLAIFERDFKTLFSNIVFISQAATIVVIFGVMVFTMGRQLVAEVDFGEVLPGFLKFWMFFGGFLLSLVLWTSGGFGTNALSREHRSFYLFQSLPISPKDHHMGRFLSAMVATEIFNLTLCIIYGIFIKVGFLNIFLVFLGMTIGSIIANAIGLWMGTTNINTNWKKPEEISKGGMKFLLIYFASLISVGLVIGAYVLMMAISEGNHNIASLVLTLLVGLLMILSLHFSYKSYQHGFFDV